MKKYDSYKNSGIEWIGEIPSHWEIVKVKYNFSFRTGFTPPSGKEEYHQDGKYIWINIGDLNEKIIVDSANKITDKAIEDYKPTVVPQGSLLYSFKLSVGKVAFVGKDCYTNEALFSIDPDGKNNLNFFYYSLPEQIIKNANENIYGAKILNQELIKNAVLIIPSDKEQTAIATYLDCKTSEIDNLIANKKRLVELYEEEKTAIINQAVTKGIDANVKMKDSGIEWLGEVPEHWEVNRLKYLGKFINGFSFKSTDFIQSGIRVLKISNIQNMHINWSDESFIDESYYGIYKDFRVLKNDIVFALTRPIISTGIKVALIDSDEKILINQRNSIYRPISINVKWIYYLLLSSNFIQEFDSKIDKTGQQPNISSFDIGEITVPITIEEEQSLIIRHIETECNRIDAKIAKTKKLIDLLTEYRTALISEVVTGKIKVVNL
jgi:type I restriction enzyme S subunit